MEKPSAVKQFDALYLGGYAVVIIGSFLGIATIRAAMTAAGLPGAAGPVMYASMLFGIAIVALLWFLISPKHNNIAKWVALVFVVIGLLSSLRSIAGPASVINGVALKASSTALTVSLIGQILQAVGLSRLFTPAGKLWMNQGGAAIDPAYRAGAVPGAGPVRDPYAPDQPPYPPAR